MPEQRPITPAARPGLSSLFRGRGPTPIRPDTGLPGSRPAAATREMLERRFSGLNTPDALLAAFADGLSGLGGELADMGLRLQAACAEEDWSRVARLLRQLLDKYIRTIEASPVPGDTRTSGERLRDLTVHLLDDMAAALQPRNLAEQADTLADALRQWQPGLPLEPLEQQLRLFDQQLRQTGQASQELRAAMLALFSQLLDNICQLLAPDSWLHGQILQVQPLLDEPVDAHALQQALQDLRQASYQQEVLRAGMDQASCAIEQAMPGLAGQWAGFATTDAGLEFVDRVRALPLALASARNGAELVDVLACLQRDTVHLQEQLQHEHSRHADTRAALAQCQQRNRELEARLQAAGGQPDSLTGLPAAQRLGSLVAQCLAQMPVLNLGLLAIDGLAELHRQHGRLASAARQQTLARQLLPLLHGDEHLLRLPEGLFVLLMPGASLLAAQDRMMALRRQLASLAPDAPLLRASVMRWNDSLGVDTHLDQLEAALPATGSLDGVELV